VARRLGAMGRKGVLASYLRKTAKAIRNQVPSAMLAEDALEVVESVKASSGSVEVALAWRMAEMCTQRVTETLSRAHAMSARARAASYSSEVGDIWRVLLLGRSFAAQVEARR